MTRSVNPPRLGVKQSERLQKILLYIILILLALLIIIPLLWMFSTSVKPKADS